MVSSRGAIRSELKSGSVGVRAIKVWLEYVFRYGNWENRYRCNRWIEVVSTKNSLKLLDSLGHCSTNEQVFINSTVWNY